MTKKPDDANNNSDLENGLDPETASLMRTPQWGKLMAEIAEDDARKANMKRTTNKEALGRVFKIQDKLCAIRDNSEFPLEIATTYTKRKDDIMMMLIGVGAELQDEWKEAFIEAVKAADKLSLQADETGERFNATFIVYNLNTYTK